ncbi:MOSC domain-containing protein [Nisaea acidiphila]|uniref:MOSC domain-containing protein n=2 Tax=Nisaea acidiphila TaxID=1862145 RepID=A0A9J7B185_9PROT|nr:MOSC domain-containing protein [Nisaea acidiphila]
MGKVSQIYRFPVKGMTGESLESVPLEAGRMLPNDRRFGILHGASARRVEAGDRDWKPKANFLQLALHEKLAQLEARFDEASEVLQIWRKGRNVSSGKLSDVNGRTVLEQFFAAFMAKESRGQPRIVESGEQPYSDVKVPFVSIINLESVRDLERVVGRKVDPMRFRGNILIEGVPAWEEFTWVGKKVRIGDAEVTVAERIGRCAATNVDPATAERDLTIPRDLQNGFGHTDCGIYVDVTSSGTIKVGDPVEPVAG